MIQNIRDLIKLGKSSKTPAETGQFVFQALELLEEIEKNHEEILFLFYWFHLDSKTHPCIVHAIDETVKRIAGDKYDKFVKNFDADKATIDWQVLDDSARDEALKKAPIQRLKL